MASIILGFVGPLSSGKGTAAAYLKEKYNAEVFRFSTMLRDVSTRLYVEHTRENLQNLSLALRQTFGDDLMARVIAQDVKNASGELVVVDGVRRLPDIAHLKDVPGFTLVAITADEKIRYERMITRGENADDNSKTFEQFQLDGKKEAEVHITEVAATAAHTIDNNGSKEDLYRQLDELIANLK